MTLLAFAAEGPFCVATAGVRPAPTLLVSNASSSTQRWTLPHGTEQQTRCLARNRRQYNVCRPSVAPAGSADDATRRTRHAQPQRTDCPTPFPECLWLHSHGRPSRCSGVTRFPAPRAEATDHSAPFIKFY